MRANRPFQTAPPHRTVCSTVRWHGARWKKRSAKRDFARGVTRPLSSLTPCFLFAADPRRSDQDSVASSAAPCASTVPHRAFVSGLNAIAALMAACSIFMAGAHDGVSGALWREAQHGAREVTTKRSGEARRSRPARSLCRAKLGPSSACAARPAHDDASQGSAAPLRHRAHEAL